MRANHVRIMNETFKYRGHDNAASPPPKLPHIAMLLHLTDADAMGASGTRRTAVRTGKALTRIDRASTFNE